MIDVFQCFNPFDLINKKMQYKLKLCIDARMINNSGIGIYIKNIIPYLVDKFEVTLLGDANELNYLEAKKIIPVKSPIYSIREQFELPQIVPHCDIFWSPHFNVPLLRVKATKRIVTIHDAFHLFFYKKLSLMQKLYSKLLINKAVNASKVIITVSDFSKSEIINYTNSEPDKVKVIHNGIKQARLLKDFESVRVKYKLPLKYILFVGNVKPHKNLKNLLKAYLLLNTEIRNEFKIVIVGNKDGFIIADNELFCLIDTSTTLEENIVFTGFVDEDDMDTIYSNASLFVFPSIYEGFGLPPLEAMLNNCPVIVSNIGSLKEVCGDAVVYFNPIEPGDISNKIAEILTNPLLIAELKMKGLERIKLFSWKDAANKHIDLFSQVISYAI